MSSIRVRVIYSSSGGLKRPGRRRPALSLFSAREKGNVVHLSPKEQQKRRRVIASVNHLPQSVIFPTRRGEDLFLDFSVSHFHVLRNSRSKSAKHSTILLLFLFYSLAHLIATQRLVTTALAALIRTNRPDYQFFVFWFLNH